jgi:hypothetical protein
VFRIFAYKISRRLAFSHIEAGLPSNTAFLELHFSMLGEISGKVRSRHESDMNRCTSDIKHRNAFRAIIC